MSIKKDIKINSFLDGIQLEGPELAAQEITYSRHKNSHQLSQDLVPIPEIDQDLQNNNIDSITDQSNRRIFQILAPDGFDSLAVGFKSPT